VRGRRPNESPEPSRIASRKYRAAINAQGFTGRVCGVRASSFPAWRGIPTAPEPGVRHCIIRRSPDDRYRVLVPLRVDGDAGIRKIASAFGDQGRGCRPGRSLPVRPANRLHAPRRRCIRRASSAPWQMQGAAHGRPSECRRSYLKMVTPMAIPIRKLISSRSPAPPRIPTLEGISDGTDKTTPLPAGNCSPPWRPAMIWNPTSSPST